jgi:hypothetical protein
VLHTSREFSSSHSSNHLFSREFVCITGSTMSAQVLTGEMYNVSFAARNGASVRGSHQVRIHSLAFALQSPHSTTHQEHQQPTMPPLCYLPAAGNSKSPLAICYLSILWRPDSWQFAKNREKVGDVAGELHRSMVCNVLMLFELLKVASWVHTE